MTTKRKDTIKDTPITDSVDEELIENLDAEAVALEIAEAPSEMEEVQGSVLHIPDVARQLYAERGWDLQWVRIYRPDFRGELDLQNIQKKESRGYQFVPRSEIPGIKAAMTGFFGKEISEGSHGLYIVGDLALVKVPLSQKKARKRELNEKTKARSRAIINDLRKHAAMPSEQRNEGWKIERNQPRSRDVSLGEDEVNEE